MLSSYLGLAILGLLAVYAYRHYYMSREDETWQDQVAWLEEKKRKEKEAKDDLGINI
jgi:hypothetical protein